MTTENFYEAVGAGMRADEPRAPVEPGDELHSAFFDHHGTLVERVDLVERVTPKRLVLVGAANEHGRVERAREEVYEGRRLVAVVNQRGLYATRQASLASLLSRLSYLREYHLRESQGFADQESRVAAAAETPV
jgi:hypothetical protein